MKKNILNDLVPQKLIRLATTGFFTILAGTGCIGQKENPPNILFILMDDHATQAVSAYGSQINSTPNIDRIASEGALFTNSFCTNSICAPSRAVILTGKYSHLISNFDLENDPKEMKNLYRSESQSATIENLKNKMSDLKRKYQVVAETVNEPGN